MSSSVSSAFTSQIEVRLLSFRWALRKNPALPAIVLWCFPCNLTTKVLIHPGSPGTSHRGGGGGAPPYGLWHFRAPA